MQLLGRLGPTKGRSTFSFGLHSMIKIILFGSMISCSSNSNFEPTRIVPTYSNNGVAELCARLEIKEASEFCALPDGHTQKNLISMFTLIMLNNYYDPDYVLPLLRNLPSRAYCGSTLPIPYDLRLDNCPHPSTCDEDYTCIFVLSQYIGTLELRFDVEGNISRFNILDTNMFATS